MAENAFGTLLQFGDGGSHETWTTIAGVGDIEGPEIGRDLEDVTSHDSDGGYPEMLPTGLLSMGEVKFDIFYDPNGATHDASTGLIAAIENATLKHMKIVWPDDANTTWTGYAYVTKFSPKAPVKGILTAEVTIQPSGEWTLA